MINECSILKDLFRDLVGGKVSSEKKDADYKKIETLMGNCDKEKLATALEGVNVIDSLIRDMSGESVNIVLHSLSVFSRVFEVKPEIVKRPETVLRGLVSILQSNASLTKVSDVNVKALQCIGLLCPSLKSFGKEGPAFKSILLQCMVETGNDNITIALKFQALLLFKSLLQFKLLEFKDSNNWLKIIITLVFDEKANVREAALKVAEIYKNQLTGSEEYLDVLANNLVPSKYSKILIEMILSDKNWAHIWRLLVEILGKRLHTSSALVNSLLAVEEKAFKTSNVETKKEAFNCWNSLVLNFSLEQSVLSSDRRVKLITIPLRANNCRNGEVALVKLNVWWNIIKLMKSDVTNFSEMVLTPFLCFCYGSVPESSHSMSNGQSRLNSSNAGEACAKLYPLVRVASLHALCELVSKSAGIPLPAEMSKDLVVEPLVDPPIVSQKVFCALSRLLTQSLGEAVILGGIDVQQTPYIIHCWHSLLTLISQGTEEPLYSGDLASKDLKNVSMVKELLRLLANLLETAALLSDGKITLVILSMIESLVAGDYAFPPSVLNSHAYGVGNLIVMNSSPSLYMSVLLLASAFAVDKKLHPRIKDIFSQLIRIGCSSVLSPLPFARAILKKMEKDNCDQPPTVMMPYFLELWVLIANHLSDVIDKEGSVNEGNGASHDFHCIYGMLMFPISCALKIDQSQESLDPVLKPWARLFDLFVINARLVATAQSHEVVEDLCKKILSIYKKSTTSWTCFANGVQFILLMYQKSYFEALWKECAKKLPKGEKSNGQQNSQQLLVLVTGKIASNFSKMPDKNSSDRDNVSRHKSIMQYFILIFTSSSSYNFVSFVLEKGLQCLSYYLQLTVDSKQHQQLRNEVIILWEKFLHFLEKALPCCTSKAQTVVDSLSPLFLEAFGHPLVPVVEHTKHYWNRSLGQFFSNVNIPKSLSDVLDDVLKDTSGSEDIMGNMVAVDAQADVFAKPEKRRSKSKQKTGSPMVVKESQSTVHPSENSVEFKIIPSKPKTSILTDHQKEMMKERRIDIPALYQDLTQDSASQGCSQENPAAVSALKPAPTIVTEEDANHPFSENLQQETNIEKLTELNKMVMFKVPSSEKTNSALNEGAVRVHNTSDPSPTRETAKLGERNSDSHSKEVSCSTMNDLSKDVSTSKKRGRKRKQNFDLTNVSETTSELPKVDNAVEVPEKSASLVCSNLGKVNETTNRKEKSSSKKEAGESAASTDQPNQRHSVDKEDSVPGMPLGPCSSNVETVKSSVSQDRVPEGPVQDVPKLGISNSPVEQVPAVDSTTTGSKKPTTNTVGSLKSGCGKQPVTNAAHNVTSAKEGGDSGCSSLTADAEEVSKSLEKAASEANHTNDTSDNAEKSRVGLINVKISSPRKISDLEFTSFSTNPSETYSTSSVAPGDDQNIDKTLGSPINKSTVSSKNKMLPVSPRSKLTGNSPSLDNWVIVTKRDNEDKLPEKQTVLDGGSNNIPLIVLDSDPDDVDENLEAHEIYVFSNSEDLVDSSQDPMVSSNIPLKGPLKKCTINLSRVSDIIPEEVAFIQYEGRTVRCNMSPRKEDGKAEEESKKVTPNCSPVVSNVFSPRTSNSRGARILNMAQGNKEKSADENSESPVVDAGSRAVLQNSDSNLQQSPLSHLKTHELNNSTPPSKKPRRIRPMHIGSVSPQYQSLEIGCVASEGEVTIHSYSPNASPGGSVMKRKKPAGEDSISPLSKKTRRVSFADPIVSRQVEFCVPESERKFKKSSVHRCLKLANVSINNESVTLSQLVGKFHQSKASPNSDNSETTPQGKLMGITSSLQSSPLANDDTSEDIIVISSKSAYERSTRVEKNMQEAQHSVVNDNDSVEILEVEDSTTKKTDSNEEGIIIVQDTELNRGSSMLAASSTHHVKDSSLKDTEPSGSGMEIEIINSVQELAVVESHTDDGCPEETLPSSHDAALVDERLPENLERTRKPSVTTHNFVSEQNREISENSEKSVSSSVLQAQGNILSDSISNSQQSLDSSKTSDSSVLDSDVEEPRTDKLNSQEEAFPPLRDCTDSVNMIIDQVSTKLWKERCKQSLEKRQIFTIGDLSRLTENIVEKIPFKRNKWQTLKAELKAYHSLISNTDQSLETPESSNMDHPTEMEVDADDSDMQKFRETLSKMSAKDILKELHALNLTDAVFQVMGNEKNCTSNEPSSRIKTRSEKLSKSPAALKKFESISVQVSEFEVLSELKLTKKKPVEETSSISVQVSEDDLMAGKFEPLKSKPTEASKESISIQVTESELGTSVDKSLQIPKMSTSIAIQVSDGDMLSRMESYELLQSVIGRSDFKDAVGELSQEKLMKLMKLVVRNAHEKVVLFDGSVDLTAKRILHCVVRELMKDDGPVDTFKTLMWIFHNTLFSKEYIKAIPPLLSGVDESVVSELIINHEGIMDSIQNKMPAARGLKMAVNVLDQKNISLLPEEDIDRLNDILDNHRTCGELFDRYTRVLKERIMGNNFSR